MSTSAILVVAGLFHLVLLVGHGTHIALAHGVLWGTGRRSAPRDLTDLDRRFERTIANNTESMIAFAPVIAGTLLLSAETSFTLLVAQIYVAARVAFAVLYLCNIPYIRSVAWFLGVISIAVIALQTLFAVL